MLPKFFCHFVTVVFSIVHVAKCLNSEEKFSWESNNLDRVGGSNERVNGTEGGKYPGAPTVGDLGPLVFRRQLVNESMEHIQLVDNGVVAKSSFVPMVSSNFSTVLSADSDNITLTNDTQENNNRTSTELMALRPRTQNWNNTVVIRNGKKYRLIKVKKNFKNLKDFENEHNQTKRRSLKLLPNLLSILPVQWMTRGRRNETVGPKLRAENDTFWAKLSPVSKEEENSEERQPTEKVKKLLNLFTIVKFENGECYANGIKGTCLLQKECEEKGGKFMATCAEVLGVCCYYEKTCGQKVNETVTYFVNEGFPDSSTLAPKICTLTVHKADPDVKQLRLDFLNFQLRDPVNGTCLHDRFVISGQNSNDFVPEICGINTGQHIYVDVEESNGPYNLNMITVGEYFPRNFRIKVTQVKNSQELAPKNCLQYFTEPTGVIQSFNYQNLIYENPEFITMGYFNNLNYAICIKKLRGFCSVTYENEEYESLHPTFQLVNVDLDGEKLLPPRQAGAETFDCPDDYLVINGIRLCGEKLNDASVEIDFTKNHPVTDTSNGPFVLSVRTDATINGRGFSLKYSQNPCLI